MDLAFYHTYFSYLKNLDLVVKNKFCFVAVTKSVPGWFFGERYMPFAPNDELFKKCEEHFDRNYFFIEYIKQLKKLDKDKVKEELCAFSKDGKPIVLVNWEDLKRESEGRVAFAWLFGLTLEAVDKFYDLDYVLKKEANQKELVGTNFLEL